MTMQIAQATRPRWKPPVDRDRLDEAIRLGYITLRDGRDGMYNAYFNWCYHHRLPFVEVYRRRTLCDVRLDMYSCQWHLSPQAVKLATILFCRLPGRNYRKSTISCAERFAEFYDIPIEHAEDCARWLYELALSCRPAEGAPKTYF